MNKKIVTALILYLVVFIMMFLSSFFKVEFVVDITKTYKTDGFSFKSDEALLKRSNKDFEVYFENLSGSVGVIGRKESKSLLESFGYNNLSLYDYSKFIYDNEESNIKKLTDLKQSYNKEYYYFTYNFKEGINDLFYLKAMYETDEDYWIINFACTKDKQKEYESKFKKWANTIEFK